MIYYNLFMDIMQIITFIFLYFENFINYFSLIFLNNIYINIDKYWIDIILNNYAERSVWAALIILIYRYIF